MSRRGTTLIEVLTALTAFTILAGSSYTAVCRHGIHAQMNEEREVARHLLAGFEERFRIRAPNLGTLLVDLPATHGLREAQINVVAFAPPRTPAGPPGFGSPVGQSGSDTVRLHVGITWTSADGEHVWISNYSVVPFQEK